MTILIKPYLSNRVKPKPDFNFDLSYSIGDRTTLIMSAFWRGKEDVLVNRNPDNCPFILPMLREAWMRGYETELMDMTDAQMMYTTLY